MIIVELKGPSPELNSYLDFMIAAEKELRDWVNDNIGIPQELLGNPSPRPFKCDVGYSQCTEQGHCKGWC